MRNIQILPICLLSAVLAACSSEQNPLQLEPLANASPKNIIFILTDDHRFDFMGFTGKVPWLETPNLDRLASEGAYFPNTYVTTSLCSPSRASILTGLYPRRGKGAVRRGPSCKRSALRPVLYDRLVSVGRLHGWQSSASRLLFRGRPVQCRELRRRSQFVCCESDAAERQPLRRCQRLYNRGDL